MKKEIKLLIESFFDDIEDNVTDSVKDVVGSFAGKRAIQDIKLPGRLKDVTKYPDTISNDEIDRYVNYKNLINKLWPLLVTDKSSEMFQYTFDVLLLKETDMGTFDIVRLGFGTGIKDTACKLYINGGVIEYALFNWRTINVTTKNISINFCNSIFNIIYYEFNFIIKRLLYPLGGLLTDHNDIIINIDKDSIPVRDLPELHKLYMGLFGAFGDNFKNEYEPKATKGSKVIIYNNEPPCNNVSYVLNLANILKKQKYKSIYYLSYATETYEIDDAFALWSIENNNTLFDLKKQNVIVDLSNRCINKVIELYNEENNTNLYFLELVTSLEDLVINKGKDKLFGNYIEINAMPRYISDTDKNKSHYFKIRAKCYASGKIDIISWDHQQY